MEKQCLRDRQVLPRWHQQDRRCHRRPGAPAGGFRDEAPEGAYAKIECWRSRSHWLTIVVPIALDTQADMMRGRASRDLMVRYLRVLSGYAAERTGRHCIVRPATIASVMQVDVRTVKRCRAVARDLGLEVVVREGRMLDDAERKEAMRTGSKQRGLSTEVALTMPRALSRALWTATPSRGPQGSSTSAPKNLPHLAAARGEQNDAAPPRPSTKKAGRLRHAHRLGAALSQRVPWLRQEAPGRLAPALSRFATADPAWTAGELSWALADVVRRRGYDPAALTPDRIRTRPAAVLASLLRHLDPVADHPRAAEQWAAEPQSTEPCGHHDCDGHGWLRDPRAAAEREAHPLSVPCPRCSAAVRAVHDDEATF